MMLLGVTSAGKSSASVDSTEHAVHKKLSSKRFASWHTVDAVCYSKHIDSPACCSDAALPYKVSPQDMCQHQQAVQGSWRVNPLFTIGPPLLIPVSLEAVGLLDGPVLVTELCRSIVPLLVL